MRAGERRGIHLALLPAAVLLGGCGTIGPPIPPEEIGIAAKIEEAKKKEAEQAKKAAEPPPPEAEAEPEEDVPDDVTQPLQMPR